MHKSVVSESPVTIVTGASGTIGASIASDLAHRGHRVVRMSRHRSSDTGDLGTWVLTDVRCRESVAAGIREIIDETGRLDHLVLCAGVLAPDPADVGAGDDDQMRTNCDGVLNVVAESVEFLEATEGSIVVLSTTLVDRYFPGRSGYLASKAALEVRCRHLAVELGPRGIRINVVRPGYINSGIRRAGSSSGHSVARALPLGRVGTPHDLHGAVEFLLSDRAAWITGATLNVDGGRSAT